MNLRNCLSPGDFVIPVPCGALITLVYGTKGIIENVFVGHEEKDFKSASPELMSLIRESRWNIPLHISFKDGTTRVRGVLHPKEECFITRSMGDASYDEYMIAHAIKDPKSFEFLAVHTETFAAVLMGYGPIQQWMKVSGFSTVSGFLAPVDMSRDNFNQVWSNIAKHEPSLRFAYAIEYASYEAKGVKFIKTNCSQMKVHSCERTMTDDGRMVCTLKSSNSDSSVNHTVNVSDQIRENIQPGCLVIFDDEGRIIHVAHNSVSKKNPLMKTLTCPVCGNSYQSPTRGEVMCPDKTCPSSKLPRINMFLKRLKLPEINFEHYVKMVAEYHRLSIPDVFLFDPYKSLKIDCTLYELMFALVPPSVCGDPQLIRQFVNHCNNRKETLIYHLQRVEDVFKDSSMQSNVFCESFVRWLNDPYNISEIQSLLTMTDCLNIVSSNVKYEGEPIFRGTTICITGKFLRGSDEDIEAILAGYSANVVRTFTEDTKLVVIGGTHEGLDGMSVQHARSQMIPVYEEDDFFHAFEIDKDMAENL